MTGRGVVTCERDSLSCLVNDEAEERGVKSKNTKKSEKPFPRPSVRSSVRHTISIIIIIVTNPQTFFNSNVDKNDTVVVVVGKKLCEANTAKNEKFFLVKVNRNNLGSMSLIKCWSARFHIS